MYSRHIYRYISIINPHNNHLQAGLMEKCTDIAEIRVRALFGPEFSGLSLATI